MNRNAKDLMKSYVEYIDFSDHDLMKVQGLIDDWTGEVWLEKIPQDNMSKEFE